MTKQTLLTRRGFRRRMTSCRLCTGRGRLYDSGADQVQAIVGERSLTILLDLAQATNLGIRRGDSVKVLLLADKIIIEKADKGGNESEYK